MERNTKLVLTYHVAKRSSEGVWEFIDNLYFATSGRFQVSTDGYGPYQSAIPLVFKFGIDFAQVIKRFGGIDREDRRRYSPAQMVKTENSRLRQPRPGPRQYVAQREAEPVDSHGPPPFNPIDQRSQQELEAPRGNAWTVLRVVQFRPRSFGNQNDSGGCARFDGSRLDDRGIADRNSGLLK